MLLIFFILREDGENVTYRRLELRSFNHTDSSTPQTRTGKEKKRKELRHRTATPSAADPWETVLKILMCWKRPEKYRNFSTSLSTKYQDQPSGSLRTVDLYNLCLLFKGDWKLLVFLDFLLFVRPDLWGRETMFKNLTSKFGIPPEVSSGCAENFKKRFQQQLDRGEDRQFLARSRSVKPGCWVEMNLLTALLLNRGAECWLLLPILRRQVWLQQEQGELFLRPDVSPNSSRIHAIIRHAKKKIQSIKQVSEKYWSPSCWTQDFVAWMSFELF